MDTYDVAYASQHLVELLKRAACGEDVSISDPSLGTMKLVPTKGANALPSGVILGQWKGRMVEIPEERLLAPLTEDELASLSGEESPVDR